MIYNYSEAEKLVSDHKGRIVVVVKDTNIYVGIEKIEALFLLTHGQQWSINKSGGTLLLTALPGSAKK